MSSALPGLRRVRSGAYSARKSIPKDVRDEYARLYGPRWEAKLTLPASLNPLEAKARYAGWVISIEQRIEFIRHGTKNLPPVVVNALSHGLPVAPQVNPGAAIHTPWSLFSGWVSAKKPSHSTVNRWRAVFLDLDKRFHSAATITSDQAQAWADGLLNEKRGALTVNDTWLSAARTVFQWTVRTRKLTINPFVGVTVTEPRKVRLRETSEFTPEEAETILKATLRFDGRTVRVFDATRRWVPWICAYTGARAGEITQLRGRDVVRRDNIWAIHITPEAGTVKSGRPRIVPLHEHLIEQGFIEFVRRSGDGPLFFGDTSPLRNTKVDPTNPVRPRAVKMRERLAAWVRAIGVTDKSIRPNHAWRHTWKRRAARAGIEAGIRDAICGHSPRSVADQYETPTLSDMAEAIKKFPRYTLSNNEPQSDT